MKETIFTYLVPILIIAVAIILCIYSELIKDISYQSNKPYSFSRTQTIWWTLIIACSFSAYYGMNGVMLNINSSSLILLGISLGTVTTAKIIDNTDVDKNIRRHQDLKSRGFFIDILSDENGVSVHRFQALVFNLIFGIIYIVEFINTNTYAEFGKLELTLMGISAAFFVSTKAVENKKVPIAEGSANETDEDLTDIDESFTLNQENPEN